MEEGIVAIVRQLQKELRWDDEMLKARTGVFGHSLGCAAALIAADCLQLQRGVLCAPFTTMTDMARRAIGWPLCYLNRHRYDNIARLRAVTLRGFQGRIFHGTDDKAIPITMARKLATMFPQQLQLTEVQGSGHDEVVSDAAQAIGQAMASLSGLR
jgi:pimeloyl-ACP methyl ester carboxylesterase